MGLIDRLLGRGAQAESADVQADREAPAPEPDEGSVDRWYVPSDGDASRFIGAGGMSAFIGAGGMPALRLIPYRDTYGEYVLRLCEDRTGLLVGPSDRRLSRIGIYISQLRGENYHLAQCRDGDFHPGQPVRLVREPDNPYDPNAVAVYDATGEHMAAYVNRQKAKMLAKLIDSAAEIEAISIRGTRPGVACDQIAILAARPDVIRHLMSPRPAGAPRPANER
jgi:hypothetical protein